MAKPTILLITGAWHVPAHYQSLISSLERHGYQVFCPCLPTDSGPRIAETKHSDKINGTAEDASNGTLQPKTLDDDITFIRSSALSLLSKGNNLVVLMHSYGGVVGTSALSGLHSPPADAADGKHGIVERLIYMTSFVPFEGEGLADIFGGKLPPFLTSNQGTGVIDIDDPIGHFYNDVSEKDAKRFEDMLVVHPISAQYDAPQGRPRCAWRDIPTGYIVCEKDAGLPGFLQEMMISRIEEKGGLGKGGVSVVKLAASHSPFESVPEQVVEAVESICSGSK